MVDTVNLDRIAEDALTRLSDLREARTRLALDGISDVEIAAELRAVEAEIRDKELALERIALARGEAQRRADAQAAEARANARREAYGQAVKADERLAGAVETFNRLRTEMATAISAVQDAAEERRAWSRKAGISAMRLISATEFTGAVAAAVDAANVRSLLELGPVQPAHRHALEVPALAPLPPVRREDTPEQPRREPLPEAVPASSAAGYYKSLRRLGTTLETAVNEARHSFGEAASVEVLQRAEDELLEAETAETTVAA